MDGWDLVPGSWSVIRKEGWNWWKDSSPALIGDAAIPGDLTTHCPTVSTPVPVPPTTSIPFKEVRWDSCLSSNMSPTGNRIKLITLPWQWSARSYTTVWYVLCYGIPATLAFVVFLSSPGSFLSEPFTTPVPIPFCVALMLRTSSYFLLGLFLVN